MSSQLGECLGPVSGIDFDLGEGSSVFSNHQRECSVHPGVTTSISKSCFQSLKWLPQRLSVCIKLENSGARRLDPALWSTFTPSLLLTTRNSVKQDHDFSFPLCLTLRPKCDFRLDSPRSHSLQYLEQSKDPVPIRPILQMPASTSP